MYQQFYDEIADDSSSSARAMETLAFEKSVALLNAAKAAGPKSNAVVEALYFTTRLWNLLLDDLASEGNGLSAELRGQLISIGIWVLKCISAIRDGVHHDLQGLIDVNTSVLMGLKGQKC